MRLSVSVSGLLRMDMDRRCTHGITCVYVYVGCSSFLSCLFIVLRSVSDKDFFTRDAQPNHAAMSDETVATYVACVSPGM